MIARELFPILTTADLASALRFYCELLGGTVGFEFKGPDGGPVYVGIDIGSSHLGISRDPAHTDGPIDRFSLWVYVDDVDVAIAGLRRAGIVIRQDPVDQPWGERTAQVEDPDGNHVHIASR